MKVLFIPTCIETQHFEVQLELMAKHLKAGDEVYVAKCFRFEGHCLLYTNYDWVSCLARKMRLNLGISFFEKGSIHELPMPQVDNIPKFKEDFASLDELLEYDIDGVALGRGVASQIITRHNKDYKLDTVQFRKEIIDEIRNSYYVLLSFEKLVSKVQPDLVYVYNGRFSTSRPIVDFCKKNGINFYTHEATTINTRYILYKNTIPHDLEYNANLMRYLWEDGKEDAPDNKKEVAKQWFENRRYNVNQGFFSYTGEQTIGILPSGLDTTKKKVTIFNSTIEEYCTIPWWQNVIYKNESEGLGRILDDLKKEPNIQVYFRVHPNLKGFDNSQTREIKELANRHPEVTVIPAEDKVDSYGLMMASDVVLTFGSTIGVEACYWGKPSILAGRSYYEQLDCCYKPKNHEELVAFIKSDLPPKSIEASLSYGYWEARKGIAFEYFKQTSMYGGGTFFGHSTVLSNNISFLLKLLRLLQAKTYVKFWKKFRLFY